MTRIEGEKNTYRVEPIKEETNEIASNLFYAAAVLTRLSTLTHEIITRLQMPITPNKYGQASTRNKEIASRAVLGASLIPLVPMSIISGALGMVARCFANLCLKKPYTYFQGEAKEKVAPANKKFTVFSLNTCFIAGGFPLFKGGVEPWRARIDKMISLIRKKDADVVCLQEVHDIQASHRLFHGLKDQYAHFYLNIGPQNIGANSGLFVASKYKIENPHFVPFTTDTLLGSIKFVKKGIFGGAVKSGNDTLGYIYTTHLQHSEDDNKPTKEEQTARRKQVELLLTHKMLKEKIQGKKDYPVILTGDLNMGIEEFKTNLEQHFESTYEKYNSHTFTAATDFLNGHIWKGVEKTFGNILDHTLLLKNDLFSIETRRVETFDLKQPHLALSDHHGLLSTISPLE